MSTNSCILLTKTVIKNIYEESLARIQNKYWIKNDML